MEKSDKPPHQNPALPEFWDHRFRNQVTPWETQAIQPELRTFVEHQAQPLRALIPGCGSALEARLLCEAGWEVTALDFSAAAVERARNELGPWQHCVQQGDFFHHAFSQPFDLILERAFLCALPRKLWPGYAPRCAELLVPGGRIAGYFFFGSELKGPPFAVEPEALEHLLTPYFVRTDDRAASASIAIFSGKERWQTWERR